MSDNTKPHISYILPEHMTPDMRAEMERCANFGTPRPESQAVRAHVPAVFWSFAKTWKECFHTGVCDHKIKELCRIYVSHSVKCEFCGNQRSIKANTTGLEESDYWDLLNFEKAARYDDRQKAALRWAECIVWDLEVTEHMWSELHKHYSEPELTELGYFIAITMGQQRWLRTLNIDHHQVLAGSAGSMAPGFETAEAAAKTRSDPNYWAKKPAPHAKKTAAE
jgi:alkylhydroperoxidase family enzyme